jgi:hypothetical protein
VYSLMLNGKLYLAPIPANVNVSCSSVSIFSFNPSYSAFSTSALEPENGLSTLPTVIPLPPSLEPICRPSSPILSRRM